MKSVSFFIAIGFAIAGNLFAQISPEIKAKVPSSFIGSVSDEQLERILKALPEKPSVSALKPRKLLIFDLNVNYGGHPSIAHANTAFVLMGEKTGAYKTVVSRDPNVFKEETLSQFDAVFFNNTVGNLFEDRQLRNNLVEFVYRGGGLLGVHGTSVAFTKWPGAIEDWKEFGIMLGARGANHRENTELVVIKLDDPFHPVNYAFGGKPFEYRDEFFRFQEVYSRERVRVLFSIDTNKTDITAGRMFGNTVRPDNDYALAWVRQYGRGRVFYCTIAHNPYVFWDPLMLRFYLDAIQFALGDLKAHTTPSGRLNAKTRAYEKLNWTVGLNIKSNTTIIDTCKLASNSDLLYLSGVYGQKISQSSNVKFESGVSPAEMEMYRLGLEEHGVRMIACKVENLPPDNNQLNTLFKFLQTMGIEIVIAKPNFEQLRDFEKLCDKYDLKLAFDFSESALKPQKISNILKMAGERVGIVADIENWSRQKINLTSAFKTLKDRIIVLSLPCVGEIKESEIKRALEIVCKINVKPSLIIINYPDGDGVESRIRQTSKIIGETANNLIK